MIYYYITVLIAIVFLIVLFRAIFFIPKKQTPIKKSPINLNEEKIINNFSKIIQCKTISSKTNPKEHLEEFQKVQSLIKDFYKDIFETCELTTIMDTGILLKWKGENSNKPIVLMSHYDVVPVDEEKWENPPFSGLVKNGEIWGRGCLDTKSTFVGILEAVNYHIKKGFVPKNDIYLSFSGDEEVFGQTCPAIVEYLEKKNIKPFLVLDEGGAIVSKVFPGVKNDSALVGIAEKGVMDLKFSLKSSGGHASSPPKHTILGELAKAIVKIEKNPFPFRLTPPVIEMFNTLGRHSSFGYKIVFANLWLFAPLLNLLCKKQGGELNALVRTTVAFTMAEASKASNVLPTNASITANLRLMQKDNPEKAIRYLKNKIKNPKIKIEKLYASKASPYSNTDNKSWEILKTAILSTWENTIVSPYLMFAASDSRHYNRISENVYKFSAMKLTKEQLSLIHAHNERITIKSLIEVVEFYIRLIELC